VFDGSSRLLLALLRLSTLVEVLDDDSDEHVEHEEADEQQERDEVEKPPFVVIQPRLHTTTISLGVRADNFQLQTEIGTVQLRTGSATPTQGAVASPGF